MATSIATKKGRRLLRIATRIKKVFLNGKTNRNNSDNKHQSRRKLLGSNNYSRAERLQ